MFSVRWPRPRAPQIQVSTPATPGVIIILTILLAILGPRRIPPADQLRRVPPRQRRTHQDTRTSSLENRSVWCFSSKIDQRCHPFHLFGARGGIEEVTFWWWRSPRSNIQRPHLKCPCWWLARSSGKLKSGRKNDAWVVGHHWKHRGLWT